MNDVEVGLVVGGELVGVLLEFTFNDVHVHVENKVGPADTL